MNTSKISFATGGLMIAVAVIIDLLQFSLDIFIIGFIVDSLISLFITLFFGLWFSHLDVALMNKNPLGFLGTMLGEFVPFINAVPFWTAFVAYTVLTEWRSPSQDIL